MVVLSTILAGLLATAAVAQETFTNPVVWEDLPDNEVIRVGDAFYMTSSSFHYSPGAPVMRSYDLVNWEFVGHSVPTLDFGSNYDLTNGERAYVGGIWASSLRYRESDSKFYFVACIGFSTTYVYTASDPAGPWERASVLDVCYYDAGLLFDADDTPYVAYGNGEITVAQLNADLSAEVSSQLVYTAPSEYTLEGARMYLRDGKHYIFLTRPADGQYMLMSTSGPFGPYEVKILLDDVSLAAVPAAGAPHQGSLVDTPNGDWYYMGFSDMYPGGRTPVLAPITWGSDGFPVVTLVDGAWGNYEYPLARHDVPDGMGVYDFAGTSLREDWEWNHNPDTDSFTVDDGLTLNTVTVTDDLYEARNTLSHRIRGPQGTGTVTIDVSNMADGDSTGLSLLRDRSGYIGVTRSGDEWSLVVVTGINMDEDRNTVSTGTVAESTVIEPGTVHLRATADTAPGGSASASFSYSLDGDSFQPYGPSIELNTDWSFFPGYRWGIHNFATKSLGGSVLVTSFTNS